MYINILNKKKMKKKWITKTVIVSEDNVDAVYAVHVTKVNLPRDPLVLTGHAYSLSPGTRC